MSGYEVEHNIPTKEDKPDHPQRRPDLSTFFSTLEQVDTSNLHNAHAAPQPEQVAAVHRVLANAFEIMRGRAPDDQDDGHSGGDEALAYMIDFLRQNADDPPTEVNGVPDTFLDELERVPKKSIKKTDVCPICHNRFLDDQYPLVVELPCHKDHRFDLDCIAPWLKLNPTCPLDRKELLKKKPPPPAPADDDEEEYDDMYA